MKVDSSTFEVYPDLRSMTGSGKHYLDATKYKKELDKLLQMEQSISIYRQIALKLYYEKFVYAIKKKAGNKGKLTKSQLDQALEESVQEFKKHIDSDERKQKIKATLDEFKAELALL